MATLADENFGKLIDIAADLTKDASHPSASVHSGSEAELDYRLQLFEKALKSLRKAAATADQE